MVVRSCIWDSLLLAFLVNVADRDGNIFHLNVSIELLLLLSLVLDDSLLLFRRPAGDDRGSARGWVLDVDRGVVGLQEARLNGDYGLRCLWCRLLLRRASCYDLGRAVWLGWLGGLDSTVTTGPGFPNST